jgi:hypothetical protein
MKAMVLLHVCDVRMMRIDTQIAAVRSAASTMMINATQSVESNITIDRK